MFRLLYIAAGGAFGALLRYGLSGFIEKAMGGIFPWGTLGVNLLGCLLIGFFWELSTTIIIVPNVRAFMLIGLLGAFTTFSTFGLESLNLLEVREFGMAAMNIFLSNGLGVLLVFGGSSAARFILSLAR